MAPYRGDVATAAPSVQYRSQPALPLPLAELVFFGVLADTPFTTVSFTLPRTFGTSNATGFDAMLFGQAPAPVPEPGTLALFALGAVGIALARRRRSS